MADPILSRTGQARTLPDRPSLEHLRNEAKAHLKTIRVTDPNAQLAAAQRDVARNYGFTSWRRLRAEVEKRTGQTDPESFADKLERLEAEQGRPRKAIALDRSNLNRFVGYYQFGGRRIFTVDFDDDGLMAKLTGQMFYSLLPESPTKFFYRNSHIRAQLSFIVDETGAVTSLVLHQNGAEQPAKRVSKEHADHIEKSIEARRATNEPRPGSEDALRRMIKATQSGIPDPDLMSADLMAHFNEQLPDNKRMLKDWGEIQSIRFSGVSQADDCDIFDVKFAEAETEWRLSMSDTSIIESASFRLVP